jgi:hypothetical protein
MEIEGIKFGGIHSTRVAKSGWIRESDQRGLLT